MAAIQGPEKVLRIGIVQGGKVVQERLIKPRQHVTIGESAQNTFTFDMPGTVRKFTLFKAGKPGCYTLSFTPDMKGKIALDGRVCRLEQLVESGEASDRRGRRSLALGQSGRGRIAVGSTTVLFQFVDAPPESARMLSQNFRPRLLDADDPLFLGSLALWSALGMVLMVFVLNTVPPEIVKLEEAIEQIRTVTLQHEPRPDTEPEPVVEPEQVVDSAQSKPIIKEQTPRARTPRKPPETRAERVAEARRLRDKQEGVIQKSSLLAGLIGTRGPVNSGDTTEDVFSDSDSNFQDLKTALEGVSGVETASRGPVAMKGQSDQLGRGNASIGALSQADGGQAGISNVLVSAPQATADLEVPEAASGDVTEAIRSVLRSKAGQVKYCYEQILKTRPSLAGRLVVAVDIRGGRVSLVSIDENTTRDRDLEQCVINKIRRWRFPAEVTETVYLPFALSAE